MARELKRVLLRPDTNLLRILEDVHADKEPRLIERDGEALAVVVSPEEYAAVATTPTDEGIARALKAAGAWKDLDTDAMVERIYRARREAAPSAAIDI